MAWLACPSCGTDFKAAEGTPCPECGETETYGVDGLSDGEAVDDGT